MRRLSADEQALWARVIASVEPLEGRATPLPSAPAKARAVDDPLPRREAELRPSPERSEARRQRGANTLDGSWDRRLSRGLVQPDVSIDLHGHTLDSAHGRLMDGMTQARAMGARVVLLIAGKPRPVDPADRGERRGAIRAKVLDWLAASSHAPAIAAIRKAHVRHGGEGALYIVLRRGA